MSHDFNPLEPETFDSPHAEYRRLRAQCPVAHSDAWGGFWALMKHADVAAVSKNNKDFSTAENGARAERMEASFHAMMFFVAMLPDMIRARIFAAISLSS